jgi:hypothetical protein
MYRLRVLCAAGIVMVPPMVSAVAAPAPDSDAARRCDQLVTFYSLNYRPTEERGTPPGGVDAAVGAEECRCGHHAQGVPLLERAILRNGGRPPAPPAGSR